MNQHKKKPAGHAMSRSTKPVTVPVQSSARPLTVSNGPRNGFFIRVASLQSVTRRPDALSGLLDFWKRRKVVYPVTSWLRPNSQGKHSVGNAIDVAPLKFYIGDSEVTEAGVGWWRLYYLGYYLLLNQDFVKATPGLGVNIAMPYDWNGLDVAPGSSEWCPHYHIHVKSNSSGDFIFEGSRRDATTDWSCSYTRNLTAITGISAMLAKIKELYYQAGGSQAEITEWLTASHKISMGSAVVSPYTRKEATAAEIQYWLNSVSGLSAEKKKRATDNQLSLIVQATAGVALGFVLAKMKKNA